MDKSPDIQDDERGLYAKYRAFRLDGPNPTKLNSTIRVEGFPMPEVTEPFFLVKFDDYHGGAALRAYAASCEEQYPRVAAEIRAKLLEIELSKMPHD